LMEDLTQGYLRALGEADPQRQAAIWHILAGVEADLVEQFNAFALEFSNVTEPQARISRLPVALPYAVVWLSGYSFDMRKALAIHAHAIARAAHRQPGQLPRDKAFTLMAELFLMQHTCHWFCRSKMVAAARLLARHQTPYAQVLASVAAPTRQAYCQLPKAMKKWLRWLRAVLLGVKPQLSERERVLALLAAIDAGGMPLNPARVNDMARQLGLEVSPRAPMTETIERIRACTQRWD